MPVGSMVETLEAVGNQMEQGLKAQKQASPKPASESTVRRIQFITPPDAKGMEMKALFDNRALFDDKTGMWAALVVVAAALTAASCARETSAAGSRPPDVEVAPVEQRDVPVYHEWIGTLDGMVNTAIRAEVTGYLQSQDYAEGSFVRKGQLMFVIDPRPFDAALAQAKGQFSQAKGQLAQAKAQLAQAEAQLVQSKANQGRTQLDVDKYTPLAAQQAITQQDLDNSVQNNKAALAQMEATKAGVETAKAQIEAANAAVEAAQATVEAATVNLGFTRLVSPIDGVSGRAQVQ